VWEIYDLSLPLMRTNLQAMIDGRPDHLINLVNLRGQRG
jgi:hypothetical protein